MYEVSTSILNAEKGKEAEIILALEKARTDYIFRIGSSKN